VALKEGDKVRIDLTGGDYRVKWVGDRIVVLESGDQSCELLTTVDHLKSYVSPQNLRMRKKVGLQLRN
jgi:hypothetical protein